MAWAAVLNASLAGVVVALCTLGYRPTAWWGILPVGVLAALAEWKARQVSDSTTMSASVLPLLFAAVVLGPLGGLAVGAISNSSDFRKSRLKWAVYTPIQALTGAAAGLAAWSLVPNPSGVGQYTLAFLAAAVADLVAENLLRGITVLVRGLDPWSEIPAVASVSFLLIPFYVPLLTTFVHFYVAHANAYWLLSVELALSIPMLAAHRLITVVDHSHRRTVELAAANSRLLAANRRGVTGLVRFYEESDWYTAGHSRKVATYARDIAERMGLSDDDVDLVHLAALVHDIGKIRLPKSVLEKPGPLTLAERRLMEKHPEYGEELLREVEVEDHVRLGKIVRHHHERIDGEGYPDRLPEAEIPLLSRIIAVADAYDAMTSERPYRDAMPSQVARLRLAQAVGSQFDTSVVAAFEAILAASDEDYRTGSGRRSDPERSGTVDDETADLGSRQAVS